MHRNCKFGILRMDMLIVICELRIVQKITNFVTDSCQFY